MGILRTLHPRPDAAAGDGDDAPRESVSEERVVAWAREGELDAWTHIYHSHFERVYQFVGNLTGDPCLAEDLTQEVFARAYVALPRFNGRAALATWLCGIALNVVRKHWRSRRRRGGKHLTFRPESMSPPSAIEHADPEHHELQRQRAAALRAALETLPFHYREAFVLVALRERSPGEAAELLGISPGNVSVRVHRARARLRKQLARMGWLPRGEGGAR